MDKLEVKTLSPFYENLDEILSRIDSNKDQFHLAPEEWNYGSSHLPTWQNKQELKEKVEAWLGLNLLIPDEASFGEFRISLKSDLPRFKSIFHADPYDISVVVNLRYPEAKGEEVQSTALYRHKQTGAIELPHSVAGARKFAWVINQDTLNRDAWEEIKSISFQDNTAFAYCPRIFHAPADAFRGETFETGRLTQHFFFNIRH